MSGAQPCQGLAASPSSLLQENKSAEGAHLAAGRLPPNLPRWVWEADLQHANPTASTGLQISECDNVFNLPQGRTELLGLASITSKHLVPGFEIGMPDLCLPLCTQCHLLGRCAAFQARHSPGSPAAPRERSLADSYHDGRGAQCSRALLLLHTDCQHP